MAKRPTQLDTSWDDGRIQDIRLCELLVKYEMPATFYIPGNTDLTPEQIKDLSKKFIIGSHTMNHPNDLKLLSNTEQWQEINQGINFIKDIVGYRPERFCYPRGRYNLQTLEIVKKLDIKMARTTLVGNLDPIENHLRTPTTVHAFNRKEYGKLDWLSYGRKMLKKWQKQGGIFHFWGHSWEIDKNNDWIRLEKFLKEMHQSV
jgi:peptidoglycan/xylan/chitin deacetylase (PgdA/CDA1 family)